MTSDKQQQIQQCLSDAFHPADLLIEDQSHLHAGHEGAKEGKGHFDVVIISDAFEGKSRIQRHRMVYDALGTLLESDIHALRIRAYTAAERGSGKN